MPLETQTSALDSLQFLVLLRYLLPALLFVFVLYMLRTMGKDMSRVTRDAEARTESVGPAELIVMQGTSPAAGERFRLVSESALIGRDPACDIRISDGFASSQHAQIVREGNRYYLADLGSTNGTLVNGQPVKESLFLAAGDDIEIGEAVFRFETSR